MIKLFSLNHTSNLSITLNLAQTTFDYLFALLLS